MAPPDPAEPDPTEVDPAEDVPAKDVLAAIAAGDGAAVARHLAGLDDANLRDDEGMPLILSAADTGDVDLVRPFLDAGVAVDTVAESIDWTPLISAVQAGDAAVPLVAELIARGADVNHRESCEGATVLAMALSTRNLNENQGASADTVAALLDAGADPNQARADGWTPLMLAAQDGNPAVVRALLAAGAEVSTLKGTDTAIDIAEYWKRQEVVDLLRTAGAADPVAACVERLRRIWAELAVWFAEHAPAYAPPPVEGQGVPAAQLDALAAELGQPLPVDIRAQLLLYGATDDLHFYEYNTLSVERILTRWRGLNELRAEGAFDAATPHELPPENEEVEYTWWSPGWLPFAEDGGGNLYCLNLTPGEYGHRGQVIAWERQGGPTRPFADSFEDYLGRYRDRLVAGEYVYDAEDRSFYRP